MRAIINNIWDSERGEFTDKAMTVQYWICLFTGIFCMILCGIIR